MGAEDSKFQLSPFQQKKLIHEYHVFYDMNKDGVLTWKDFNLAREHICRMSGWKLGMSCHTEAYELFSDIWRHLQDAADENFDGIVTEEEWVNCWTQIERTAPLHTGCRKKKEGGHVPGLEHMEEEVGEEKNGVDLHIPDWLEKYIKYKFNLYDRTGDGEIDIEEFEYVLSHFSIPAKDCRAAFTMFSKGGTQRITFAYFRHLCVEYYRSTDASALGNFINGKLSYDDNLTESK